MGVSENRKPRGRSVLWYAYRRLTLRAATPIRIIASILRVTSDLSALVCCIAIVLYIGFDDTVIALNDVMPCFRVVQGVFLVTLLFNWLLRFSSMMRETRLVKWIVDIGLLISVIPVLIHRTTTPWSLWIDRTLYSPWLLIGTLACYSGVILCHSAIRLTGSRTNPSRILATSFLFFIFLGSFMLMLPRCTVGGISYSDALFVATSAVCITGLTPIDVAATFTPLGQTVLCVLMQVGALGVMTFTSFFAMFFSGNTSIHSQLMIKDMIYTKTINSLLPTLLYIFCFTLCVEIIGAAGLLWAIHGSLGMNMHDELVFAIFHSISAFCNAGFSNMPGGLGNPALLHGDQSVYIVVSILIFAGGIGFPILVNTRDAILHWLHRLWHHISGRDNKLTKIIHLYNMNTKIVLVTTLSLLVMGIVLFWVFENDNTLSGMSPLEKFAQSVFNSITPRSAGFTSVNPSGFLNITVVTIMFLMWIGGGSQSTAGGIKVNSLAAMLLNLRAIVRGDDRVIAFGRTVAPESIRRAGAVIMLSVICYLIYALLLMMLEPQLEAKTLLFECCSALFTVGSSLGATPLLGDASKILLCTAMFIGRVGIISLLVGIAGNRHRGHAVGYPTDNIIIN